MVSIKGAANVGNEAGRVITRFGGHDPVSQFLLRIAAGVAVAGLLRKEKTIE